MKILAIDPGNEKSAFVLWDGYKILKKGIWDNYDLLYDLNKGDLLAIEMVASYGMPVGKTVFETCVWIGRFMERYYSQWTNPKKDSVRWVYRKDVKMHLCQTMRAKDSNIRQALIDRFGAPGTKKSQGLLYGVSKDIWAALAVAVYQYDIKDA